MSDRTWKQLAVKTVDADLLAKLADHDVRGLAGEFAVIVREALEKRGLDPVTGEAVGRKAARRA